MFLLPSVDPESFEVPFVQIIYPHIFDLVFQILSVYCLSSVAFDHNIAAISPLIQSGRQLGPGSTAAAHIEPDLQLIRILQGRSNFFVLFSCAIADLYHDPNLLWFCKG